MGQGALRLVLTGRRGLASDGPAAEMVARWRARGVTVGTVAADVADAAAMARVMEGLGQVRGVVHAAGVATPAPLVALTKDGLAAELRAKVQGSWVLHELTAGAGVELFVGCSSVAAVWGSKGQGAYAAGNRFVDMVAQYRRGRGQAGVSVNWGPWTGGGMASAAVRETLARMGLAGIEPGQGLAALEAVLARGVAQLTVARVAWGPFKAVYEARGPRPLLAAVGVEADNPAPGTRGAGLVREGVRRRRTGGIAVLTGTVQHGRNGSRRGSHGARATVPRPADFGAGGETVER